MHNIIVRVDRDDEANVWIAQNSDIGLFLESESLETLIQRVRIAAPEMAAENGIDWCGPDIEIRIKVCCE